MMAPFAAVFLGALLFLLEPLPLQVLRNAVFDQYQRWHPRVYQPAPVRIIDIDEESLKRIGQWPWPRTRVADLIERLQQSGTAAIGMDIIFAEPDRTSPKSMSATWNLPADIQRRLESIPDHDEVLGQTLRRSRVILGFAAEREGPVRPIPARPFRFVFSGESPLPFLHPFESSITSIPLLENAATGNGALTFIPDSDGVVRRVPLAVRLKDQVMPSLIAESLRVGQDQMNYIVKTGAQKGTGVEEIRIGAVTVPTTPQGEIWVHYTRPVPDRSIPAWKVLAGETPREQIDGHIVLVGTSAQGLMDLRFSPMGTIIPGVEAHAQALEQILTATYLKRPSHAGAIEALVIVIGGLLIGVIALSTQALISAGATAAALLAAGGGAWIAFTRYGLLLDPVTPALALLVTFIVGSVVRHRTSEQRQRWVREAFSRYVSPNRVDYLVDHPDQLELGGQRRVCSFIFTDLAGFTSLMESMDPGEAVSILNAYLDQMVTIAFRHGGTLDRIVGDAVAIMFSAPVVQPDHQARALNCALEMHAFATRYADDLNAKGIAFGQSRIGVHTGEVIVGNFGGSTMFDYRALGDAVNTASRLEGANKYLGTLLCVSEATLSGCPDAVVRPVGSLVLKGKTRPLMVFEPVEASGRDGGEPARDPVYEQAFERMRQRDPEARDTFEQLAAERPHDPLVQFHLKRLKAGEEGETIILAEK
ncbi:MAG: adenylate/guanylate cyclase domain-containing protein [Deltaproteobacteria bacterium HGW-Deltaproteobacteria-19]|nr:MAG: adenylate/guanylate cyclase domain-containing protein [Deltaproteobacteria bacterium HGW-Deltaproteobacteria-19]